MLLLALACAAPTPSKSTTHSGAPTPPTPSTTTGTSFAGRWYRGIRRSGSYGSTYYTYDSGYPYPVYVDGYYSCVGYVDLRVDPSATPPVEGWLYCDPDEGELGAYRVSGTLTSPTTATAVAQRSCESEATLSWDAVTDLVEFRTTFCDLPALSLTLELERIEELPTPPTGEHTG